MTVRSYAIGDIHGQRDALLAAHRRIEADRAACGDPEAPVIHLGDLVDRGPDSAGVIELLIEGADRGAPWITILGNHDRMFRGFLGDPDYQDPGLRADLSWLNPRLGGDTTLASYGIADAFERPRDEVHGEALERVPERHRAFLAGLPLTHLRGELLFVHAGIRPGLPLAEQTETDLVWIRSGFLEDPRDHGPLLVHGHTALEAPRHFGNRVDLDSGAGYGRPLTAAVIEGRQVWVLTDDGRVPLHPDPE